MARLSAGPSGDITGQARGYAISAAITRLQEGSAPLAVVNFLRGMVHGLSPSAAGAIYQSAKLRAAQIASIATRPASSVIPQDYHLERSTLIPAYKYVVEISYTDARTGVYQVRPGAIDSRTQLSIDGLTAKAIRLIPTLESVSWRLGQPEEPSQPINVSVEVKRAYCRSC